MLTLNSKESTLSGDKKPSEELLKTIDEAWTEIEKIVNICQQIKLTFRQDGISEESGRRLTKEQMKDISSELVDAYFDKDYEKIIDLYLGGKAK
jgi:hypothetical protein